MMKKFLLLLVLSGLVPLLTADDFTAFWKMNNPAQTIPEGKPLVAGETGTVFTTGSEFIAFYNDKTVPVKSGQVITVAAAVSGKGKAWLGVNGYTDMAYAHCAGADRDTSFTASEKPVRRKFRFTLTGDGLQCLRLKLVVSANSAITLADVEVTVSDPAHFVPVRSWQLTNSDRAEAGVKHLEKADTAVTLRAGKQAADVFNTDAFPVKPGQTVTLAGKVSGKGKIWWGVIGYADTGYKPCPAASKDIGVPLTAAPKAEQFKFKVTAKDAAALRVRVILAAGTEAVLDEVSLKAE